MNFDTIIYRQQDVSSVVFSRFFQICFGGWAVFLMCFHGWAVCSAVLRCFCAFYGACFATIGFFYFFEGDSGLMSISRLELAPPELYNGSCVDGE
jgi:hypothetical protein